MTAMDVDEEAFSQQLDRVQQDFSQLFSATSSSVSLSQAELLAYNKDFSLKDCSFKLPKWVDQFINEALRKYKSQVDEMLALKDMLTKDIEAYTKRSGPQRRCCLKKVEFNT